MAELKEIGAAVEPAFLLGNFAFRLRSSDWNLLYSVSRMLPRIELSEGRLASGDSHFAHRDSSMHFHIIDLDEPADIGADKPVNLRAAGPSLALAFIIDLALRYHEQLTWLEGALLADDADGSKLTLLCGGTHSGKTTLALALSLLTGIRMVSEDLILIDWEKRQIVPFLRPLSLREGTSERIMTATNKQPDRRFTMDGWYFDSSMYHGQPVPLSIAKVVLLSPLDSTRPGPFSIQALSSHDLLKALLPLSNLLHNFDALNMVPELFVDATCHVIKGGQLVDRINWLQQH